MSVSDSLACLGAMHPQGESSQAIHSKYATTWLNDLGQVTYPSRLSFLTAKQKVEADKPLGPFLLQDSLSHAPSLLLLLLLLVSQGR